VTAPASHGVRAAPLAYGGSRAKTQTSSWWKTGGILLPAMAWDYEIARREDYVRTLALRERSKYMYIFQNENQLSVDCL
jgi:hypothetical protein